MFLKSRIKRQEEQHRQVKLQIKAKFRSQNPVKYFVLMVSIELWIFIVHVADILLELILTNPLHDFSKTKRSVKNSVSEDAKRKYFPLIFF